MAEAIIAAADEVIAGQHDAEFPLVVWQTGSGTQTNMNVNEVIANRASEIVGRRARHGTEGPSQRSRQHGPIVERRVSHRHACGRRRGLRGRLIPSVRNASRHPGQKAEAFRELVKIGRTHLMDATPLTLGQEISGWVQLLDNGLKHVEESIPHLCELALGGTAVGTGLERTPRVRRSRGGRAGQADGSSFRHGPQQVRGAFGTRRPAFCARSTQDAGGLADEDRQRRALDGLRPAQRPGRDLDPRKRAGQLDHAGKGQPDAERGDDDGRQPGHGQRRRDQHGRRLGNFELNVMKPLIIHNFLRSVRLLADVCVSFNDHCATGIEPNRERIDDLLNRSLDVRDRAQSPHRL